MRDHRTPDYTMTPINGPSSASARSGQYIKSHLRAAAAVVAVLAVFAGCSPAHPTAARRLPTTTMTGPPRPTTTVGAACPAWATAARAWPLARQAAQLLVVPSFDFNITALDTAIGQGAGGVLFLGGASAPPDLPQRIAAANRAGPDGVPLAVMADEEGGGVQRVATIAGTMPWPRQAAASMSPQQVTRLAARVGLRMKEAGVTVDLAPVVDVDDRPGPSATNPDGLRSFSPDPGIAANYGIAFMDGMMSAGVLPVLKHFPGLGGSIGNTDYGTAKTTPIAELRHQGLIPFRDAIAAGAPAVMVSNAVVPGLTQRPSSVSPAVITGLLRHELGFGGLVLTDSLSAGAISDAGYTLPQAVVAAIAAGADMVLFGSTLTPRDLAALNPQTVNATTAALTRAIADAANAGTLPRSRLADALSHVFAAKGVPAHCLQGQGT